jgi:hypothetical protein
MLPIDSTPFDPPSDEALEGAIGWTFITEHPPETPGKWRPTGWRVVYPDHLLTIDYATGIAVSDTALYSPERETAAA